MKLYLGDIVEYKGRLARTVGSRPEGYRDCGCCPLPKHVFDLSFLDTKEFVRGIKYEEFQLVDHPDNWEQSVRTAGWDSTEEYNQWLQSHTFKDTTPQARQHNRVWLKEDCLAEDWEIKGE